MQCGYWIVISANGELHMAHSAFPQRIKFNVFESREKASAALAMQLEESLREAIEKRGKAALVVSGGTSPLDLFRELRSRNLPWEKITLIASDERVVPPGHPESNETMIRNELMQQCAVNAQLVSLLPAGGPGHAAGDIPTHFDAVVLGMGDDGHTASLFPDSPDIEQALESAAASIRLGVPRLGSERVSLTPASLLSSERIDLLFFGQKKRGVFEAALHAGDVCEYPVRAVIQQHRVPVNVFWAP